MQRNTVFWIGVALIGVGGVLIMLATPRSTVAPIIPVIPSSEATTTVTGATTTPVTVSTKKFPVNANDRIVSWDFTGAASGNDILEQKAQTDSVHLTTLLGTGEYDDYDLYVGIANDAAMLGDGRRAYANYNAAITIHPNKGLAYVNLATLMNSLGAFATAADAYTRAVTVEPGMLVYHTERLNYLREHFGANNAVMVSAFTDASKQFGDAAAILSIEARWLTEQMRYADAVTAWEKVIALSPGTDTSTIDTEITRLKAKL